MTVSVAAHFYQSAPGAVLQASTVNTYPTRPDVAATGGDGFGVKATSAAPTDDDEFGGHVYEGWGSDMDSQTYSETSLSVPADTVVADRMVMTLRKRITLDANWAVGKYAFAYSREPDGTITKASAPYHIR